MYRIKGSPNQGLFGATPGLFIGFVDVNSLEVNCHI